MGNFIVLLERDAYLAQVEDVLIECEDKITCEDIWIQMENMALVIDLYESKGYDFWIIGNEWQQEKIALDYSWLFLKFSYRYF